MVAPSTDADGRDAARTNSEPGPRDETALGGSGAQAEGGSEAPIDGEVPSTDEPNAGEPAADEATASETAASQVAASLVPAAVVPTATAFTMPAGQGALDATVSAGDVAAATQASATAAARAGEMGAGFLAQAQGAPATDATGSESALQASMQAATNESTRPAAELRGDAAAATPSSAGSSQPGGAAMDARGGMGDGNASGNQSGDSSGNRSGASSGNQSGNQANAELSAPQDQGAATDAMADARIRAAARAEEALAVAAQAAELPVAAKGTPAVDAVAGRLSEVEASVARDRVVNSLEQGILSIEAKSGDAAPAASMASMGTQPAAMPTASPDGSMLSAALGDPAADLARPSLDPAPTGRLAAKGIDILSNQRGGAITMRLEPPALGQLRIELQISQGAVVADFTAATPEARVLLEANLGMLRERLESQGLAVERMTVHGGRGTEAAPIATTAQGGEFRQDSNGSGSDARDRGDRSGGRQDAADGESRGRRDGEQGRERGSRDGRRDESGFLGMLEAQRTQDAARRMRKAV